MFITTNNKIGSSSTQKSVVVQVFIACFVVVLQDPNKRNRKDPESRGLLMDIHTNHKRIYKG